MKKKHLTRAISSLLVLSLVGCAGGNSSAASSAAAEGKYKAGTYTASADGHNGPVTVSVTVSADKIESVEITDHAETAGISDAAIADLPGAIVEAQSPNVDAVSGSTDTSTAIITAVKDALTQAGATFDDEAAAPSATENAAITDSCS